MQLVQRLVLERRDDEQERIGPGERGFVDLVGIDDEVLAQERQPGRSPGGGEILERPAEVRPLGQDRERGRAPALVRGHDLLECRPVAQRARRRRAALVLGHQRQPLTAQGRPQRPSGRPVGHRALQHRQRPVGTALRHRLARDAHDPLEHGHVTAPVLSRPRHVGASSRLRST